ncbi:hypothetical protein PGTUg99_018455 [Puccinia graminis f. sp. tritici]|uniref:Uncharacterized protein n=1 Tax=Puccinia graminis f. sp. tritici TaxID=56615 RepID=A0A5B0SH96_PUCGR|nr:hypothetical protein PGTUg99_019997 [Puccinia graminis f. sp. tritici]KAA1137556.1 hypothetical protein PGTUg99_018455 [Puccinia graminis f. sp. tritici]
MLFCMKPTNVGRQLDQRGSLALIWKQAGSGRDICPAGSHDLQTARELLHMLERTMTNRTASAHFLDLEADRHSAGHFPSRPSHFACSSGCFTPNQTDSPPGHRSGPPEG